MDNTLYEQNVQLNQIIERLAELNQMVPETEMDEHRIKLERELLLEKFRDSTESLEEKANDTAGYIKHLENNVKEIDEEIKRLKARKDSFNNSISFLKSALSTLFNLCDKKKLKTALYTFTLAKGKGKVVIEDETKLTEEYLVPQPPKPDKQKLYDDMANQGLIIDGVKLEYIESLRIR